MNNEREKKTNANKWKPERGTLYVAPNSSIALVLWLSTAVVCVSICLTDRDTIALKSHLAILHMDSLF